MRWRSLICTIVKHEDLDKKVQSNRLWQKLETKGKTALKKYIWGGGGEAKSNKATQYLSEKLCSVTNVMRKRWPKLHATFWRRNINMLHRLLNRLRAPLCAGMYTSVHTGTYRPVQFHHCQSHEGKWANVENTQLHLLSNHKCHTAASFFIPAHYTS